MENKDELRKKVIALEAEYNQLKAVLQENEAAFTEDEKNEIKNALKKIKEEHDSLMPTQFVKDIKAMENKKAAKKSNSKKSRYNTKPKKKAKKEKTAKDVVELIKKETSKKKVGRPKKVKSETGNTIKKETVIIKEKPLKNKGKKLATEIKVIRDDKKKQVEAIDEIDKVAKEMANHFSTYAKEQKIDINKLKKGKDKLKSNCKDMLDQLASDVSKQASENAKEKIIETISNTKFEQGGKVSKDTKETTKPNVVEMETPCGIVEAEIEETKTKFAADGQIKKHRNSKPKSFFSIFFGIKN